MYNRHREEDTDCINFEFPFITFLMVLTLVITIHDFKVEHRSTYIILLIIMSVVALGVWCLSADGNEVDAVRQCGFTVD